MASSRYRCYRMAAELRRQGIHVEICDPPPRKFRPQSAKRCLAELLRLHRLLAGVGQQDVLYLQRPLQNRLFVALAVLHKRSRGLKMVFDFCDPIHLRSPIEMRLLTRTADVVVVSCEDLAAYGRRHNSNVHVIPNSLPPAEIADRPAAQQGSPPIVGWVGDASVHKANLELLLEPFSRVAARSPFVFRMVGTRRAKELVARFSSNPGLQVDAIEWLEPERVRDAVRSFHVAVLPLTPIAWNRKLATKLVEYLSAGVPVVASPVGDNRFLLIDQQNGMLASTADDWVRRLSALFRAPDLRESLAAKGLEVVQERCRLDTNARQLAGILAELSSRSVI